MHISLVDYWPKTQAGELDSVDVILERFKGTTFELDKETLEKSINGGLKSVEVETLVKLLWIARILSPDGDTELFDIIGFD